MSGEREDKTSTRTVLYQEVPWDLRLVGCGIGAAIAAYPYLRALETGEAFSPDAMVLLWVAAGLALMAFFIFMPSRILFADGAALTLISRGLSGKRSETVPPEAVESVEVQAIMSRYESGSYHVAVKLKGRRGRFLGEDFDTEAEAKAAQAGLLAALGRKDKEGT